MASSFVPWARWYNLFETSLKTERPPVSMATMSPNFLSFVSRWRPRLVHSNSKHEDSKNNDNKQTNKQNNESRCFWLYYFSVQVSSLGLYADSTTAYASNTKISALKLSPNQDLENLSSWFALNYLIRSMTRKPKQ